MPLLEVAAAVIERAGGEFLLAQRPVGKVYAGWWEFPGGKVHDGESAAAALARELHEELGIDVRRAYPWVTRVHAYEHATVRLNFFRVVEWQGEPHPKEEQAIRWQRLGEPMAEPMLPANAPVLAALGLPLEYAITDSRRYGVETMLRLIERRLEGGLKLLRVREPGMPEAELAAFTQRVLELAQGAGARVIVKSGFTLCSSGGIHFTARELMALGARPRGLCGASVHTRVELERAMQLELDFAVLGPVKATPTHPGAATLGWHGFAAIAKGATLPVYAIGGLAPRDLHEARSAGAHGLAMIRGSWD